MALDSGHVDARGRGGIVAENIDGLPAHASARGALFIIENLVIKFPAALRRFVVKTVFPWVANMLYLAARTHNRAAVYLHAAHITGLRAFWTDWLPRKHRYHA